MDLSDYQLEIHVVFALTPVSQLIDTSSIYYLSLSLLNNHHYTTKDTIRSGKFIPSTNETTNPI